MLVIGRGVNRLGAFTLPFLTVALTDVLGASVSAAGALMAMFGIGSIASRLGGGWLADRVGRRATIVLGLTLTAAAQLGLAGAPNFAAAAVAIGVLGLAYEIYEPPSQALIADVVPGPARPAAYGLLSASLAVAGVAAGLLAAAVGAVDLRLLFVIDAATCLGCAVLLGLALPGGVRRGPASQRPRGASPWRDRRLLGLTASGVGFAAIYLQINAALGLTLDRRGVPASYVGLLLAASGLTIVAGQPLLRWRRLARLDPWRAMAVGYIVLGVGLLATALATTLPTFVAATVVWSGGDLILLGRVYGLVADLAPAHARAQYFSVYGLSWGIATVIGPPAGTLLLDQAGPTALWTASAAACGVLAAGQPTLARLVTRTRSG
jgi:MFS family permease